MRVLDFGLDFGIAFAVGLGACSAAGAGGSSTGAVQRRTVGSTGSGTSGSSGGVSTGSNGTSTSAGSGTTGGASCPAVPITSLNDCDAGLIEERFTAVDYLTGQPITASLEFSDLDDPTSTAQATDCGDFFYCMAPGHILVGSLTAPGYASMLLCDIQADASQYYGAIAIPSEPDLMATLQTLPASAPAFDASLAAILVRVASTGALACPTGWSFQLQDLDGGAVDAAAAFASGSGFLAGAVDTTGRAIELLYNIDPSVDQVTMVGSHDGGGDPDSGCSFRGYDRETTGVMHLRGGTFTGIGYAVD